MKRINRMAITLLSILFCCDLPIQGQSFDTSLWNDFIHENSGRTFRDTFLLQTFNNTSTDSWPYTTKGSTAVFDATTAGIKNASEGLSLKLYPGSELIMTDIPDNNFTKIRIYAPYAAYQLKKGENLLVSAYRKNKPIVKKPWLIPEKNGYTAHYKEQKEDELYSTPYIYIEEDRPSFINPQNIQLNIQGTKSETSGFYAFDSIYATREVPLFLLFDKDHQWDEETFWQETLPHPNGTSLVKGRVEVDMDIHSHELYLGNGEIVVHKENDLTVNRLYICNPDISLIAQGDLHIKDSLIVNIPIPEKGKWYFLSFPFDVYPEAIDQRFELGDNQTTTSGNFFYMQTYNGERRAVRRRATGNWGVISTSMKQDNKPLFEKHKGYLLALDRQADYNSLRLAIPAEQIPVDFGKAVSLPITVDHGGDGEHDGWYLCGNPLSAPLLLDQITPNMDLDGHIYIYNGSEYIGYPIGSSYALPPFAPFFIKTSKATTLILNSTPLAATHQLLPSFPPLHTLMAEPRSTDISTLIPAEKDRESYIEGKILYLNLVSAGRVSMTDMNGRKWLDQFVPAGVSTISLNYLPGIYLIHIEAGLYRAQHKLIQTQ
ncbi:T9SS type A sorting domain-containing protein [Parabacteroides sp. PF5-9]|uniref:T9SS type A sorting domain-containing protein n=1 Tax=Parabacteroides sp. PF5-9 TaxID=1742404 RepID=UPI002476C196|nr:T9SS type A sorting domain-containing protein [Parabacteroides sp. PF5-9]MDH6356923.1 hypothetical protein [Parabacteroides sp. PF5-9]